MAITGSLFSNYRSNYLTKTFKSRAEAEAAEKQFLATDEGKAKLSLEKSSQPMLAQQILAQGTSSKWSGQGYGSAQKNAEDMAKILSSIGITDIRQFGEIKETKPAVTVYTYDAPKIKRNFGISFGGQVTATKQPDGTFIADIPTGVTNADGEPVTKRTIVPADKVKPTYYYETEDGLNAVEPSKLSFKDGVPYAQIGETKFGNKVTGQPVPKTYGERQTGNAWGGTFSGDGNTGYRVDFAPDGTPIFYTTGASSSDAGELMPLLSIGLGLALPGAGAAIGAALGAGSGAAATALGNAVIGGVMAEAQGGDFLKGALTAGAGSALGGVIRPELASATGSNFLANSLTSGAISELSGGKFLQGAIQGGISGLTQDAKLSLADQYLNSVEPGVGYDASTSPTELDVINAYPELAPTANLTQGVTDILDYAANAPSVQLAAGPNYVGELSGVPYDPNYVSDSGTGAYRLEIGGTGDQQGTEPSQTTVPTQEQAQLDIADLISQLEPYLAQNPTMQDIQSIIGQQNFATPDDIQAAISGIDFPDNMTPQDVQNIVSEAFQNNPGITATDVQEIVQGALNNLPPGLSSDDVRNIVTDAVSSIPSAPTEQDIIKIIGGQGLATGQDLGNLANQLGMTQQELFNQLNQVEQGFGQQVTNLESQLTQQGRDFMDYLQQQNIDYETALNEALVAQQNQFGSALGQTTEDLLSEIASSGSGLQQEFQTGLQDLADQLGLTQQELFNQLGQTQESLGGEISNLQNQFTSFDEANAQRYADLIKTVGLVGTGLGTLQTTFNLLKERSTPKQFEVVAPPSEWKSPVYGTPTTTPVPFTPSAPIDFGSPQLLQGTQFARPAVQPTQMPYDLSKVVNTLNFQSVPFVQQPMTQSFTGLANQPTSSAGLNNIIGDLNGKPVSIADIISNIQGQYGQKAAS